MTRFIDIHGFAAKEHAMPIPRSGDGIPIHPQCTADELVEFYDKLGIEKGLVNVEESEGSFQTMSNADSLARLTAACASSARSGNNALARDLDHAGRFLTEFQDRVLFGVDICAPQHFARAGTVVKWFMV